MGNNNGNDLMMMIVKHFIYKPQTAPEFPWEEVEEGRRAMASFQVEIASSAPFGGALRDHNRRDGCRESNARATQAAFQKKFKNFVRDHLNTCISISSGSAPDESAHNHNHNHDQVTNAESCSWVSNGARNNLKSLRLINRDKDESSLVSPRQSQILDRWAARQAREMVSTIETEAELLASPKLENLPSRPPSSTTSRREDSPDPSECYSEISSIGASASSLVQIWEKRLNQQKHNTAASGSPGRSSPNACCNENAFSVTGEEQCRGSEAGESTTYESLVNEEPFPDWESDKAGPSDQTRNSDAADSERVRVSDIIKRLTATNQVQSPQSSSNDENDQEQSNSVTGSPHRETDRDRVSTPQLPEHRAFAQVTCSPRIRGRRAFNDLLMQMERDRHGELNNLAERGAVSKFSQRGRIQSLLRLRLMQRGVAAYDKSHQQSTSSQVNRQPQGSTVMHLRERFSTGVEQGRTAQAEVADPRSPHGEVANNITQLDNSPSHLSKDARSQNVHGTGSHCTAPSQSSVCQTRADGHTEEARPSSDATFQGKCLETHGVELQETAETTPPTTESNANDIADEVEASNRQQYSNSETSFDEIVEEEEAGDQMYAESSYNYDETIEDVEASVQHYYDNSYDWISHISRPRSYWEDRRKAWYMEMLDTNSDNEEIRHLLERRRVSTFLSSGFRERMDRLIESHMGTQRHLVRSQEEEEDSRGRMDQLIALLKEHMRARRIPGEEVIRERVEEEEQEEEERRQEVEGEEEDEEESLVSGLFHEVNDYFNQSSSPINISSSPSVLTTWSYRDNEAGDDSDGVASKSFYQDSRQYSSSRNHHSIEMEYIYDLRGHMEQLYHEMSDLRKSIKSCVEMQMTLQQSMKREAHTVKEDKKSHDRAAKKGNCCICYEMKVDSLLYRCGHMCACLKCANELQWNSGKCPICRAPIVDVVRVYVDG